MCYENRTSVCAIDTSRLEGLTKELGWSIVASERTVKAAGPEVVTGGRQELLVKGRQEPVVVLEVKGLEE